MHPDIHVHIHLHNPEDEALIQTLKEQLKTHQAQLSAKEQEVIDISADLAKLRTALEGVKAHQAATAASEDAEDVQQNAEKQALMDQITALQEQLKTEGQLPPEQRAELDALIAEFNELRGPEVIPLPTEEV